MNLSFNPQFVPKILAGTKTHTLREDLTDKWKPGMKIHFCTGLRTKNYNLFKLGNCISTQKIWMAIDQDDHFILTVDGRVLSENELQMFRKLDGFDSLDEFKKWFEPQMKPHIFYKKVLDLKLIHWTDFRYTGLLAD